MKSINSKEDTSAINTSGIMCLIVFSVIMFSGLYFFIFNGKLSSQSQDWASFGNFISGVLMPIFTAINIWVFIKLTQTINKKQENFQSEESKRQAERHKNELDHQKRLIITQMRQIEIAQLSKTLDSSFIPESYSTSDAQSIYNSYKINLAESMTEIDSFLTENQHLFPLDKNDIAFRSLIEYHKKISEIIKKFETPDPSYTFNLSDLLELKHRAIKKLYQYMADNITN